MQKIRNVVATMILASVVSLAALAAGCSRGPEPPVAKRVTHEMIPR